MINIDPYSVVNSFESALVPKPNLVDGRDDKDRLSFLVNFASLINFYDKQDTISGSWQPFLLKDPVILVASIAKVPFKQEYNIYVAGINELEHVVQEWPTVFEPIEVPQYQEDLSLALNQLFPIITGVYQKIEYWTQFMKQAPLEYTLKTYTLEQLEKKYGAIFWATLSLQEYLSSQNVIKFLIPVDWDLYSNYDQIIWKQSKDKRPFWEVLGLYYTDDKPDSKTFQEYVDENTVDGKYTKEFLERIYTSLKYAGDETYTFYKKIVDYAWVEYDEIILKEDNYPDTLLIRTFIDLMNVYKDQINTLAEKHLDFYYTDILKQRRELASSDYVFACADLSFDDGTYLLYKDVQFNAGENEKAETILFKSVKDTVLNSGAITDVFTLSTNEARLFMNEVSNVGEKQVDENDVTLSWKTFGSPEIEDVKEMSFIMASPMLFLGLATVRIIVIDITFTEEINTETIRSADYFLSTAEEWVEVHPIFLDETSESTDSLTFMIELDLSIPPITSFGEEVEDVVQSSWPLLKIAFNAFDQLNNPPQIKSLEINVDVFESLNVNLYNDFGALSFEEPFQLFGPTPEKNQNFFIGSNEIFSKPVNGLNIKLNWDNLPPEGFCAYYKEYNNYLHPVEEKVCPEVQLVSNSFFDFLIVFFKWLIELLTNKKEPAIQPPEEPNDEPNAPADSWKDYYFNDTSFTVKFQQLVDNNWVEFLDPFNTDILFQVTGGTNQLTEIYNAPNSVTLELENSEDINLEFWSDDDVIESKSTEVKSVTILVEELTDQLKVLIDDDTVTVPLTGAFNVTVTLIREGWEETIECTNCTEITLLIPSLGQPELLYDFSDYYCIETENEEVIIRDPNPSLQLINPLELTETTTSGFMRIQLTSDYGFGSSLYPKVISSIALYNAGIIAQIVNDPEKESDLKPQPNIPYTLLVGGFSTSYIATHTYDFENGTPSKNDDYPFECYYSTPFSTYKVYDNEQGLSMNKTTLVNPVDIIIGGIPMYPSMQSEGNLLIPMQNLIFPGELSLYFELSNDFPSATDTTPLNYYCLSKEGWIELEVLSDGTQNLNCSGIITFNLPQDMTSSFPTLPEDFYYISISIPEKDANYSRTSFLKTNGFELVRTGTNYKLETKIPRIPADTITEPEQAIPQIGSVIQPFASFGGRAMETSTHKDIRVATRLTTKDRIITEQDYYRSIQLSFIDIYFSKILYKKDSNDTQVFLVKKVEDWRESNAFLPIVSTCVEKDVQNYLTDRTSAMVNLKVSNFEMSYVKISGSLSVATGYSQGEVAKLIEEQLNVFISPWINTEQDQIQIDTGLTTSQIANFIKENEAISAVNELKLQLGEKDPVTGIINYKGPAVQQIEIISDDELLFPINALCELIDFISIMIKEVFDPLSELVFSPEDFKEELSEEVQKRSNLSEEVIERIIETIVLEMILWEEEGVQPSKIKVFLEDLFQSMGLCNTIYINQKTLLVPSLDYSSLNVGTL